MLHDGDQSPWPGLNDRLVVQGEELTSSSCGRMHHGFKPCLIDAPALALMRFAAANNIGSSEVSFLLKNFFVCLTNEYSKAILDQPRSRRRATSYRSPAPANMVPGVQLDIGIGWLFLEAVAVGEQVEPSYTEGNVDGFVVVEITTLEALYQPDISLQLPDQCGADHIIFRPRAWVRPVATFASLGDLSNGTTGWS